MKRFLLAMRMLRRDWRAGELRLLVVALIVAVGSVTSVSFFTDRINQALSLQAGDLLGADLKVTSSRPLTPAILQLARKSALMQAESIEFPSMVMAGKTHQLASIKAVSEEYPLRGAIAISSKRLGSVHAAENMPRPGTVWLEPRLLNKLRLDVGDELTLGNARFKVSAILMAEPSRASGTVFNLAPRLLLSMADLPATGLVQPASRVSYNVLFSGPPAQIQTFRRAAEKILKAGARITGAEGARPEIRAALERGEKFLGLAALVSVMLSGIAIAMASRRFAERRLDGCAIMRCFGASQRDIVTIFFLELLFLALLSSLLGCLIGYLAQLGLVGLLGSLVALDLPGPSVLPVVIGMLTGLVTVVGFALPAMLHIRHVPALRVLRRELGALPGYSLSVYGAGIIAFGALIIWQTADWALGFYMLAGMVGVLLVLTGVAAGLIHLLRRWQDHIARPWRFGVMNLTRRAASSSIQVAAFGVGMTVLLLLSMVRADLLAAWQDTLPHDTPNRFLINIQAHQVGELEQHFMANGLSTPGIFPMVRGRLVAVNDDEITSDVYGDEHARRLVAREFNLSWAEELQTDNEITAGAWWGDSRDGRDELSVEEGLAKTLGIQLGDYLSFDVAGSFFKAQVSSLRKVDWDSFRVNFFVIASPGILDEYPVNYVSSIYVPPAKDSVFSQILQDFPNVTVIDVAAIMDYVRQVIERIVLAVDYVFIFTLLSGLLVLYATIQATLDVRIQENAIMRTLGAGRSQLVTALLTEFAGIGLLAGLVASWAAALLGVVLGRLVFHLPYAIDYSMILLGTFAGGVGVCIAGYLGTRQVLKRPPLQTLMERA